VKGWSGFFELTGHPEFLSFALDAGLGSRNAQGFGMVEVVREKKREQKRSVKGAYSE
jgi:CRISPR-associated endoribonuclease Cas6